MVHTCQRRLHAGHLRPATPLVYERNPAAIRPAVPLPSIRSTARALSSDSHTRPPGRLAVAGGRPSAKASEELPGGRLVYGTQIPVPPLAVDTAQPTVVAAAEETAYSVAPAEPL